MVRGSDLLVSAIEKEGSSASAAPARKTLDGSLLLHLHQLGFFLSRRDIRTLTKEGYFVMARTRRSHFRRRDHRRLLSNRWNRRRVSK